jgi:DNA polymerase-1
MIKVQEALFRRGLRTRMLLQVHDELVFDLHREEEAEATKLVVEAMQTALPLEGVPILVEAGVGANWLEAH